MFLSLWLKGYFSSKLYPGLELKIWWSNMYPIILLTIYFKLKSSITTLNISFRYTYLSITVNRKVYTLKLVNSLTKNGVDKFLNVFIHRSLKPNKNEKEIHFSKNVILTVVSQKLDLTIFAGFENNIYTFKYRLNYHYFCYIHVFSKNIIWLKYMFDWQQTKFILVFFFFQLIQRYEITLLKIFFPQPFGQLIFTMFWHLNNTSRGYFK